MHRPSIVIDTNVLISRALSPSSIAAKAVEAALKHCILIASRNTFSEFTKVLARKKFEPYITAKQQKELLRGTRRISNFIAVRKTIAICRDAKDNMFLDLAVQGDADYLLTGDKDLLVLHPFMGIEIVAPTDFLKIKW